MQVLMLWNTHLTLMSQNCLANFPPPTHLFLVVLMMWLQKEKQTLSRNCSFQFSSTLRTKQLKSSTCLVALMPSTGEDFHFPNNHKPSMGDKGWKNGLWNDICTSARNSSGAELHITSTSDKKEHQIGCEMHQCHCQHDNNKKEFDSALGFNFSINLKSKSLVNDKKIMLWQSDDGKDH